MAHFTDSIKANARPVVNTCPNAKAYYRWIITKDHLTGGQKGVQGPRNLDSKLKGKGVRFSLYDDDGILYYEGVIYGDFTGFEPLDDFGTPYAGCTKMKLAGQWL